MRLSIIIPVYNEEDHIVDVIKKVKSANTLGMEKEIIVVDDGSTDNTAYKVKSQILKVKSENQKLKVFFLEKKKNEGKGAALKVGFKKATGDILMVQDADSEYFVKDYPALLSPFIKNTKTDVVYGSRNKRRENFHNRYSYLSFYWGGLVLTWIVNFLFKITLTDQPTGYKLFSKRVKEFLLIPKENRFSYEVAVTGILAQNGISFTEVPIHYVPRTMKQGKKINALDFVKSVVIAIKYKYGYEKL